MSLKLLDLGVKEVRRWLPRYHFMWRDDNIEQVKKMIKGDDAGVPNGHKWLYGIVNNTRSGALCFRLAVCGL